MSRLSAAGSITPPGRTPAEPSADGCVLARDNGRIRYDSYSGARSPWFYDGPGRCVRTRIIDNLGLGISWGMDNRSLPTA
ncbi:hypothetical protein [Kitasatospora aureofaciens]|uniref:hypothetical protein n=1 Tax=Kitasatospora aureofaciens TaxID=1894 RepID=UPI0005269BB3|nr:hypothetical protein [Kitasatospora aureofaciens]HJD84665.1 hypothetical protein [Kitasatospora aureofaciens]